MPDPVLVVGDPVLLVRDVADALDRGGYSVVLAPQVHCSVAVARAVAPGAVIVCLPLADADGGRVLRVLRRYAADTPLLAVARDLGGGERDRLLAAGADDATAVRSDAGVLVERLGSLSRRRRHGRAWSAEGGSPSWDEELRVGDLVIRPAARSVRCAGRPVTLTPRELGVLLCLARRAGRAVARSTLLAEAWGSGRHAGRRIVDHQIVALRRKLERDPRRPRYLHTVASFGYRLEAEPRADELERRMELAG